MLCQQNLKRNISATPSWPTGPEGCLLHLIKQSCSLKTILRTLILITRVSLRVSNLKLLVFQCLVIVFQRWFLKN